MRKLLTASAALGFGLGSLAAAPAASAETLPASCTVDGHVLNASADYVPQGADHRWTTATYAISGTGTGGKSNVNTFIRERDAAGTDREVYRDNSPDSIVQHKVYLISLNNTVTRGSTREWVTFRGIFDTSFDDEKCNAYTVKI
jgi:hypothetical protein